MAGFHRAWGSRGRDREGLQEAFPYSRPYVGESHGGSIAWWRENDRWPEMRDVLGDVMGVGRI